MRFVCSSLLAYLFAPDVRGGDSTAKVSLLFFFSQDPRRILRRGSCLFLRVGDVGVYVGLGIWSWRLQYT